MNGPFFSDLPIGLLPFPFENHAVRALVAARLVALRRLAPRRDGVPSAGRLAFAAAERMVDRVHADAAVVRTKAEPAAAAGLADRDVLVIEIADLADRRETLVVDLPQLARRHLHRCEEAFLGDQLHGRSGRARNLPTLAGLQLDVVNHRAEWNVLQRQAVARQ